MSLTGEEIAQGWRDKSKLPSDGELVEVLGSDFMGEWIAKAKFKILSPNGPRYRFIGEGWMGTRARTLSNSDVEAWRPLPQEHP